MLRRTFLKFLGATAALLAVPKLPKANPLFDATEELRPVWCPEGFLPCMGQQISRNAYPDLFTIVTMGNGRKFYPKYWNKETVELPDLRPYLPSELKRAGWHDNYTRTAPMPVETVSVPLIAVGNQIAHNGRPMPAGFMLDFLVDRQQFEKTYGDKGHSDQGFGYDPYQPIEFSRVV